MDIDLVSFQHGAARNGDDRQVYQFECYYMGSRFRAPIKTSKIPSRSEAHGLSDRVLKSALRRLSGAYRSLLEYLSQSTSGSTTPDSVFVRQKSGRVAHRISSVGQTGRLRQIAFRRHC
jgi:hypothetical protein